MRSKGYEKRKSNMSTKRGYYKEILIKKSRGMENVQKTNHLKNTNIEQDWQNRERKKKAGTNKGNGRIIIKPAT